MQPFSASCRHCGSNSEVTHTHGVKKFFTVTPVYAVTFGDWTKWPYRSFSSRDCWSSRRPSPSPWWCDTLFVWRRNLFLLFSLPFTGQRGDLKANSASKWRLSSIFCQSILYFLAGVAWSAVLLPPQVVPEVSDLYPRSHNLEDLQVDRPVLLQGDVKKCGEHDWQPFPGLSSLVYVSEWSPRRQVGPPNSRGAR